MLERSGVKAMPGSISAQNLKKNSLEPTSFNVAKIGNLKVEGSPNNQGHKCRNKLS
jgi:hypothetical protein